MKENANLSVLFVCTGNICRSPTAAGVFLHLVKAAGLEAEIAVDSAGTHDYHVGEQADRRSRQHALRRGYDLDSHRARQVAKDDFDRFDLVLTMDRGHQRLLERLAPPGQRHKVRLFMTHAGVPGLEDVPDPYYGGPEGFETVLDLIERAARALLEELRRP